LDISRTGRIHGSLIETSTTPEWRYKTEGEIGSGGWTLRSRNVTGSDEMALEFYFNDVDEGKLRGFIISYDLDRNPFCSFTLLSRNEVSDEEYMAEYRRYLDRFYTPDQIHQS